MARALAVPEDWGLSVGRDGGAGWRPGMGWAIVAFLIGGLVIRGLIAWVWLPQSGFFLDLEEFQEWADVLSLNGWVGFYRPDAGYFIDYPPVYLAVVSWLDELHRLFGGEGAVPFGLLKLPPILADVGSAAIVAVIAGRVIGPAAALPAAAVLAFHPALIVDSAVYGQNDSVGSVVVVAGLLCLIRGWTEAASGLAVLAVLVKFQFGFLIPIVVVVGLRRHLGANGEPVRVLTSVAAGVATLAAVMIPFGLSIYDAAAPARSLWHRFTAASEAFPGVTQNAFNLWMNPLFDIIRPDSSGVTAGRLVDDNAALLRLGEFEVTWQLIGALLFLAITLMLLSLVVRRTDSIAILIAAFGLATALYVFPTRIHERYLVPALIVSVPLVFLRRVGWRIAYAVLSVIAFVSIYFVYTLPNLNRHLARDGVLNATALSPWGIYLLSAAAVACAVWIVFAAIRPPALLAGATEPARAGSDANGSRLSRRRPATRAWTAHLIGRLRPHWRVAVIVGVSLAAAALAGRVSFGASGWLWNLDLPKIHLPLAVLAHEALIEGRLPLWSDRLGMGFPLYAEGQIGAFYPPNWLIYQLDALPAMDLSRLLHLTMAGTGAAFLALRVAGSLPGALVASVVTVLGGAIVTKAEWWNLVAAYGWMPWVLLPLAGRGPPSRRAVALAGAAWGIQALTGHPNTWFLTGIVAVVLLIRAPWVAALGRAAVFGLLGAAIGAVQVIPTVLLQRISVRSVGLSADDLFTSASTPFDVIGLGFMNAFVRGGGDGAWDFATTWYPDGIFALLEASAYVGLPAVALAVIGARTRRARRWLVVGGLMILIGVVAAFRPEWWEATPVLNGLRSPVRSYLVLTLAIGILAAIGVARLGRESSGGRAGIVAMAALVAAYVFVLASARSVPAVFDWLLGLSTGSFDAAGAENARANAVAALTSPWPLVLELGAAAVMGWLLLWRRSPRVVAGAMMVTALPLVLLAPAANPIRPASDLSYAGSSYVSTVAAQAPHRVLTIGQPGYYAGMPNQLAAAGIADVDMFSSLNLLAGDALTARLREADPTTVLRRAAGIDLVVQFGASCVGEPVGQVPEHAANVCRVPGALTAPYWIPASAAQPTAGSGMPSASLDADAAVATARSLRRVAPDAYVLDAPEAGWVYLDRAWWHAWQVTVDGIDAPVLAAAGGQLVEVPSGRHDIVTRLVPWDALIGLALGAIALALTGAWLRWPRDLGSRRRASGEPLDGRGPHAPRVDDGADGERHRELEANQATDPVRGQYE